MDLEVLEPIINRISRTYGYSHDEIKDFEQIGRITCWEISEKNGEYPMNYYRTAIKRAIIEEIIRSNANKRKPKNGLTSLDIILKEYPEAIKLSDTVSKKGYESNNCNIIDSLSLREKYGHFYINGKNGIKRQNNPKKIARNIIKIAIEEIEKIPREEISEKVDKDFTKRMGLRGLIWAFYNNSIFSALSDCYPFLNMYDIRKPNGFWSGKNGYDNAKTAISYFIKKKKIKNEKDCKRITEKDFEKFGLEAMLSVLFNGSPFLALKTHFQELKPWNMKNIKKGFLDSDENQRGFLDAFLIENNRSPLNGLTAEETYDLHLRDFVNLKSMENFGMAGLLFNKYGHSPYNLFLHHYPDQILPWTLQTMQSWKDNPRKTGAEAIRWLFDDYLKIDLEEIPSYATERLFRNVGFSGILTNKRIGYNTSTYRAVNSAYPGIFSKEDFKNTRETVILSKNNLKRRN